MVKKLEERLKILRLRNKMSQKSIAEELGMSRPTYAAMEKGEREPTVSEIEKLASLYQVSLRSLIEGHEPKISISLEKSKKKPDKEPEIRISVPQKNVEKFREVLLYILEKVGAKPNIGETAIYKLLYFIDFDYYEEHEQQLIGATYQRNKYGPTPVEFNKIVNEMIKNGELEKVPSKHFQYQQKKYLGHRPPDLTKLSGLEKAHIDDVLNRLSDKSAKELSDYSHGDIPWKVHEDGEIISYESVFYRDHKYSVRNYSDEI